MITFYNAVVNMLSFTGSMYSLRRWLNTSIDHPETIDKLPESHPRGFVKLFRKRRISIVEAYVKIIGFMGSNKCNERLAALKLLTEQILNSKSIKMPINTARVQMAIMKEAVKNKDDVRFQMERLRDFSISSFGQPKVIRKYLKEIGLIEVPETGQPLKELNMGWDTHVHDNTSSGRKTPTQLIIDAFIKGISEITVVYNTLNHIEIINEAIEAGRILGIKVNLGLEFSCGPENATFHYMFLFPHFENIINFVDYLDSNENFLSDFIKGIEQNQKHRIQALEDAIQSFNISDLASINEGYNQDSPYYLNKLSLGDLNSIIPLKHATHIHLGELLYNKLQPVMFNRVLYLKSLKRISDSQHKLNKISEWEFRNIKKRYEAVRMEYSELSPEKLLAQYFPNCPAFEPKTVFTSLKETFKVQENPVEDSLYDVFPLRKQIKIIHPLKHNIALAVKNIFENYKYIGHAEIYSMHDTVNLDHYELEFFSQFIGYLNNNHVEALKVLLEEEGIAFDEAELIECANFCALHKIAPACGSNSTGRKSYIPGMGFIYRKSFVKQQNQEYLKRHYALPVFVSKTIAEFKGIDVENEDLLRENDIISMGQAKTLPLKEVGDENIVRPIPLKQAWRYLVPWLKSLIYAIIGFIPALLTVGWTYALIWFGITATRNAITDIISGRGYRLKEWHIKNIDYIYLSHSLFWTGFSVPLLNFVKTQFVLLYPFDQSGILYELIQFFFICIINGSYLATHNTIRGFDKTTIRANFFRSMMAWPFATLFSPLGNLMLIPSIVQAKFWSDFLGGVIEGTNKFKQRINLRQRDINKLLPNIVARTTETRIIAILDLLYFYKNDPRTRNSLKTILLKKHSVWERLLIALGIKSEPSCENDFFDFEYLNRWFSETANFFKLTDFILENYKPQQEILLTNLICETFYDFHRWLIKNKPKCLANHNNNHREN